MKKYIVIASLVLLACVLLVCTSCEEGDASKEVSVNVEGVEMTAIIKNISDKIEVEVVEGEYGASGIYWVNVGPDTVYLDESGNYVTKSAIKVGDTIEITYGGQVAMSYPPQISAMKIQIK